MSVSVIKQFPEQQRGFALLEVALAVIIAAAVFLATIEFLDISTHRASAQRIAQEINEIFNAGISYYLANADTWPDSMQTLVDSGLLPALPINPWGYDYKVDSSGTKKSTTNWVIGTCAPASVANNLAALLPYGTITDSTMDHCNVVSKSIKYVTTTINQTIGGQKDNLVATMVASGDSVAAPACPIVSGKQYVPHIYLLPAAFDSGGHMISAMTARAEPKHSPTSQYPNGYWVVHLLLTTDLGTYEDNGKTMGDSDPAAIVAFTDCRPPAE